MTFEIGAGAITICAVILVFGLLSLAPSKAPHKATGRVVGALIVQSWVAPTVAPALTPSPSPTPSADAPTLPNTSNANPPSAEPTPTRTRPTGAPKPSPPSGPKDQPPVVVLVVTPTGAPLTVIADASQSVDTDSTPIANFVFNFGDGQSDSPLFGESRVTHKYAGPGRYVVSVVATDTAGHSSSASMTVIVP